MDNDVLVNVESVSKKFCRTLKRSLWYGVRDIGSELIGRKVNHNQLRQDEFWAVKDVSFELKRGECLGLIGHNGAGKSTLLKMVNGLIKPDQGSICMKGRIGALIELGAGFNPILTGRENIYVNGQILGFTKKEIDQKFEAIVEFSEIGEFIDTPVQNYSSGMRVRLGFAVASQMEPDVLIVDEVLAVGDMGFRIKCMNEVQRMLSNAAVIFVTHSMPFLSRICNQGILLNKGTTEFVTNDIGVLVEKYMSRFNAGKKAVYGSDQLEITEIKINDKKVTIDNEITIEHGSQLNIGMRVDFYTPCEDFAVRIVIFNLEQRPVLDTNSLLVGDTFNINGSKSVRIEVLRLQLHLNPGKYSVSIIFLKKDQSGNIARFDNVCEFMVKSDYISWAETFQPAEWLFIN